MTASGVAAVNQLKTHCPQGHEYSAENTYSSGGRRQCKTCKRAAQNQRYADGKVRKRTAEETRRQTLRRFGLSPEEYAGLLAAQGNTCAGCLQSETITVRGRRMPLAVDHHHETGKVRGLLCHNCNRALGLLRDNPDTLVRLLAYLS